MFGSSQADEQVVVEREQESQLARLLDEDDWSAVRRVEAAAGLPAYKVPQDILQEVEQFKITKETAQAAAAAPGDGQPAAAAASKQQQQQAAAIGEQQLQQQKPAAQLSEPLQQQPALTSPSPQAQPQTVGVAAAAAPDHEPLPKPKAPTGRRLPAAVEGASRHSQCAGVTLTGVVQHCKSAWPGLHAHLLLQEEGQVLRIQARVPQYCSSFNITVATTAGTDALVCGAAGCEIEEIEDVRSVDGIREVQETGMIEEFIEEKDIFDETPPPAAAPPPPRQQAVDQSTANELRRANLKEAQQLMQELGQINGFM